MKLVIVTGMSGAGKTVALKMLEDFGYYCVDNLPVQLIPKFAELTLNSEYTSGAALGTDIRSGGKLNDLKDVLAGLQNEKIEYEILYLDADDETLVKRYKSSRRAHPLSGNGSLEDGIREERKQLSFLRKQADYLIDTGGLLTKDLKKELAKIFVNREGYRNLFITVLSFGFMYGLPAEADLIFDVRFLPNPFYEESLRTKTGEAKEVSDYVFSNGAGDQFLTKLTDMILFLIPHYIAEGKTKLVIGIGCTGGQHRSVAVACELSKRLENIKDIGVKTEHRDADRNRRTV